MSGQESFNWNTDTWGAIDSHYAEDKCLSKHQIESYNDFVDNVIPQIIERNNPVVIATDYDDNIKDFKKKYEIRFMQTYLSKPLIQENNDVIKPLYPKEARLRGLVYTSPMFIDVTHTLILKDDNGNVISQPDLTDVETKIPIFKMPIMLRSKYCHLSDLSNMGLAEMGECEYDQGGYFIVNGGEKVLIMQERVAENQVFVWPPSKSSTSKYSHEAEIKTSIDQRFYPVKTNKVKLTKEPSTKAVKDSLNKGGITGRTFRVQMPYVKEDIPLFIMFRALGIVTEREIYEIILSNVDSVGSNYTNMLMASVDESRIKGVTTQESALQYISRQLNVSFTKDLQEQDKEIKLKYVKDILNRELLPHIGQNNRKKAFFLGYMTRKLIDCFFEIRPYDDRDHYSSKRLDLAGPLLTQLFRAGFIKLVKDLRQQILPKLASGMTTLFPSLRKIIQGCNIESKLKFGLATGNWSTQKTAIASSKKGIAQVLSRLSPIAPLSHIRRVQSPLERAGSKIVAPRRLHATHFGMCCPNETPEGSQVGIVKNLSMMTYITVQTSDYPLRIALTELGVKDLTEISPAEVAVSTKIFLNGDWFGVIADKLAKKLYDQLRILKRHGIIVPYTSIAWFIDWKEIVILTVGGRYSRPVYIVENGELLLKQLYDNNPEFRQKFRAGQIPWMDFLSGFHNDTGSGFGDLKVNNGAVVEYLDTNELETSMVAMTMADLLANHPNNAYYMYYSHCEIHPIMMMGVVSTMIPFSDHNQSPRNCYQCLWKEEPILMANNTYKKIGDIQVGDMVITVDPVTLNRSAAKVIHQYVKPTTKRIVKVTTLSGRSLVVTEDHLFLTDNGWKKAGNLMLSDAICVCPGELDNYQQQSDDDLMFDEHDLYEALPSHVHQYPNNLYTPLDWSRMVQVINGSVFSPVGTFEEYPNVEIADITVDSPHHSFITGSRMCVHNSSMGKQSIGYYVTNYNSRMDTMAHVLVYGHKPLVATRTMKYIMMDKLPHGTQSMLLYACYTGYNQEDSVILNGDAVQRGFFSTIFSRTYTDQERKHKSATTASEKFTRPNPNKKDTRDIKHGSYAAIQEDGTPIIGQVVNGGDVIIGKVVEQKEPDPSGFAYKDVSTTVRYNENGTIDMVIPDDSVPANRRIHNYNSDGNKFIKVRVSILRKPIIGDKFASRHAQKGTNGMMYSQDDLPFNCYGLVPDVIINPHGIPSRMTAAKLIETLLGKAGVAHGQYQDATPFTEFSLQFFMNLLKSYAQNEFGNEVFYNGQLGHMFNVLFFYGPTYYQRLKHMVDDKIHCLTMDHEVLTIDGWKHFEQLSLGDKVATIKDGILVYECPTRLLYYPNYNGAFYHVETDMIDLLVTDKHRMLCIIADNGAVGGEGDFKLVPVCDLKNATAEYKTATHWPANDYQFALPLLPRRAIHMDSWLIFIGEWFHSGQVVNNSVSVHKYPGDTQLNAALQTLQVCYDEDERSGVVYLHDADIINYLQTLDCTFPQWVWQLSWRQCRIFLDHVIPEDDHVPRDTYLHTWADDIQRLCFHAGWTCIVGTEPESYKSLQILRHETHPMVDGATDMTIASAPTSLSASQPVFCLQMPSEIFYVRRNGKAAWTGNSRETGPVQLLTRQPAEGRSRDGGLRLGEMERDCQIAHGVPKFLKERMMDSSDPFRVHISKKEKTMIVANPERNLYRFNGQNIKEDEVFEIQLPYSMKLLLQEVQSMGIDVRLDAT